MTDFTSTPLDPDRPDGPLFVDRPRTVAPICDLYGHEVVHPAHTHADYIARYDHARTCPTCERLSANYPDLLPAGPALHSTHTAYGIAHGDFVR